MRKALLPVFVIVSCCMFFLGCIKSGPNITTTNPSMTANVSTTYKFVSSATTPVTIDSQSHDTTQTLVITGYGSDKLWPNDKIILSIASYHGQTGIWSIVQGQASAAYYHAGVLDPATGGVISITKVTSNTLIGYFSFNTLGNVPVTNGEFTVNIP